LTIELPIGSKQGTYDLAFLSNTGAQVLGASGTAELHDHNVTLKASIDLSGVQPGLYILAVRQAGVEWIRYPVRVV
jgi:hypothetical protein